MKEAGFFLREAGKLFTPNRLDTLIHFVTNRCNARCDFCFYLEETNKKVDEFTLDEVQQFTRKIKSLKGLIISGGEPFLRGDLVDIVSAYVNNCHIEVVQIPTNGFLSDQIISSVESLISKFPQLNLSVAVSLDPANGASDHAFRQSRLKKRQQTN